MSETVSGRERGPDPGWRLDPRSEVIARGPSIRELLRLRAVYGEGRWRKLEGVATVRLPDGIMVKAELHWYEAHGIGMRETKIKRLLG